MHYFVNRSLASLFPTVNILGYYGTCRHFSGKIFCFELVIIARWMFCYCIQRTCQRVLCNTITFIDRHLCSWLPGRISALKWPVVASSQKINFACSLWSNFCIWIMLLILIVVTVTVSSQCTCVVAGRIRWNHSVGFRASVWSGDSVGISWVEGKEEPAWSRCPGNGLCWSGSCCQFCYVDLKLCTWWVQQ